MKEQISVCWLRRDLRLDDNAALYHALKSPYPVLLLFIFDRNILERLTNPADARVNFIYDTITNVHEYLKGYKSSIEIKHGTPEKCWSQIFDKYDVKGVFANHDYEPYGRKRDAALAEYLASENIEFRTFKDHVIFEKEEILKADGKPYTVFTPYFRQWRQKLDKFYTRSYPIQMYSRNFLTTNPLRIPSLTDLGFEISNQNFPEKSFSAKLEEYEEKRDYPGDDATTKIGIHLRFGTVSIRNAVTEALSGDANKWLAELAWRDFYMMILWHFPKIVNSSFKPSYDNIQWLNNERHFSAWCSGNTGYPLVDAGMRQLNKTGFMHNRVRMLTASFLTKHLLIDWRWGEAYFAEKLLDYEMASNVGGWQWACGCGNDAAPYFRIFNPELQTKKFDPDLDYINKWVPEYNQPNYPLPIVDHKYARERALQAFKKALDNR